MTQGVIDTIRKGAEVATYFQQRATRSTILQLCNALEAAQKENQRLTDEAAGLNSALEYFRETQNDLISAFIAK